MRLLRASGQLSGEDFDLTATVGISKDGGVPDGVALVEFSEALLDTDEARLTAARAAVIDAVGEAGLVDASGVASAFNAIDRIADATGMPLLDSVLEETADFREELGLNDFLTAGAE